MRRVLPAFLAALLLLPALSHAEVRIQTYELPKEGGHPHDVAVGADGIVWYTAQRDGKLGRLDPASGRVELVPLGQGAAPHGVVIGPDGAPWVTEGGTNAIVRVDPQTREVRSWSLPAGRGYVNLNTLTFDHRGRVWFTGQNGVYGRLDPRDHRQVEIEILARVGRGARGLAQHVEGEAQWPERARPPGGLGGGFGEHELPAENAHRLAHGGAHDRLPQAREQALQRRGVVVPLHERPGEEQRPVRGARAAPVHRGELLAQ